MSEMSDNKIEELQKEVRELRFLLAGTCIHHNSRIESLEKYVEESDRMSSQFKSTGFLGKFLHRSRGFQMPFAPIHRKLADVHKFFQRKVFHGMGYEKLVDEFTKEGNIKKYFQAMKIS